MPIGVVTLGPASTFSEALGVSVTQLLSGTGFASLGTSYNKTLVASGSLLVTSSTTAGQVVLTYTVPAGQTLYLETLSVQALPTTPTTTFVDMGSWSIQLPSGTDSFVGREVNATTGLDLPFLVMFAEPLPFAAASVIRVLANPNVTSSVSWRASLAGYARP